MDIYVLGLLEGGPAQQSGKIQVPACTGGAMGRGLGRGRSPLVVGPSAGGCRGAGSGMGAGQGALSPSSGAGRWGVPCCGEEGGLGRGWGWGTSCCGGRGDVARGLPLWQWPVLQRQSPGQVSDQLVEINGEPTLGMTHARAVEQIRRGGSRIRLVLRKGDGFVPDYGESCPPPASLPLHDPPPAFPGEVVRPHSDPPPHPWGDGTTLSDPSCIPGEMGQPHHDTLPSEGRWCDP
uniref:PDZ domain-containing protein n=1 Tax=Terrapene triunguis TaxID=2587831 RepID=A0A674JR20_9SAUR